MTKRSLCAAVLVIALVFSCMPCRGSIPGSARAEETDDIQLECMLTGNSGAVIMAQDAISAQTDSELVSLDINENILTVTANDNTAGIADIAVTIGDSTVTVQVPVGYTAFEFGGDRVTVYEGSDSTYEVTGINAAAEEYTVDGESLILPEGTDDNGNKYYENSDNFSLNVNIKKKGGTFVFFGTGDNMSVSVAKAATAPATLLFAGLDLTSELTSPLTVKKNSESTVTLTALEGYENTLTDSLFNDADTYGAEDDGGNGENPQYAESACIKAKANADLTLGGNGTLNLNCVTKNAIKVGEYGSLTIEDVTLNVNSAKHGISCDNTLSIHSGSITITAVEDALRTDPDAVNAEEGCAALITIEGGEFIIKSGSDGIQSAGDLTITGGLFYITAGAGYDDAEFDGDTMSCKAIKATLTDESEDAVANNMLTITGGRFKLDCSDDAVHSDFDMTVTGGEFDIYTGDDAFHADNDLIMGMIDADNVLDVNIHTCYEGLEGITVTVNNGKYQILASDDGINAADGSQSGQEPGQPGDNPMPTGEPGETPPAPPTGDPGNPPPSGAPNPPPSGDPGQNPPPSGAPNPPPTGDPGQPGQPGYVDDGTFVITINDGSININAINAEGDGIDSNGSIYVNGGTLTVFGAKANSPDEPFDCGGQFVIKGGTVFGAGSYSFGTLPSNDSQSYITMRSNVSENDTIRVKNGDTEVYSIVAVKDINYAIYSSSEMTSTDGWTIAADNGTEPSNPPTPIQPHPDFITGDLNGDEKVNTADAVVVLKYAADMITLDTNQQRAGDCNHDGAINTADAVLILKYAADMISEF